MKTTWDSSKDVNQPRIDPDGLPAGRSRLSAFLRYEPTDQKGLPLPPGCVGGGRGITLLGIQPLTASNWTIPRVCHGPFRSGQLRRFSAYSVPIFERGYAMRLGLLIVAGLAVAPSARADELPHTNPTGSSDDPAMPVTVIALPQADPAAPPTATPNCDPDSCRIPGSIRGSGEYLPWSMKSGQLPPLATRAIGAPPILGQPGTRDLFGSTIDVDERSGGRFVLGMPFSESRTTGLELGYWFLGSRTSGFSAGGTANPS